MKSAIGAYYVAMIDLMLVSLAIGWWTGIPLIIMAVVIPAGIFMGQLGAIFNLKYTAPWPKFCFDKNVIIQTKKGPVKICDIKIIIFNDIYRI